MRQILACPERVATETAAAAAPLIRHCSECSSGGGNVFHPRLFACLFVSKKLEKDVDGFW